MSRKTIRRDAQPGPENDPSWGLCDQPEPPLAGREGLRLDEADRPAALGEAARYAQGGLAVRLQLRRAQLMRENCKALITAWLKQQQIPHYTEDTISLPGTRLRRTKGKRPFGLRYTLTAASVPWIAVSDEMVFIRERCRGGNSPAVRIEGARQRRCSRNSPTLLTCNGGSSSFFALGLPCGWRIRVQGIALRRNSRCAASSESLAWCRSKSAKQVEPSIKSRLVHHALGCRGDAVRIWL